MFPKKTRKQYPSVYGNIDQTIYACQIKPPVTKPHLWKQKEIDEPEIDERIMERKDHLYFVINTAVGVGGNGMNKVKIVHIRFLLIPMHPNYRDPEVISIYPHSISQEPD